MEKKCIIINKIIVIKTKITVRNILQVLRHDINGMPDIAQ